MSILSPHTKKKKTSPQIQEAAKLVGIGIIHQQNGNYDIAKSKIQSGIEKIKQPLINDSSLDREMLLNYYSLFEKFLLNCNNQQEIEKNNSDVQCLLDKHDTSNQHKETIKDLYDDYAKFNFSNNLNSEKNSIEIFNLTNKIMNFFAKAFDYGCYMTKDIFLRKEIFTQMNAKIELLHQKYETYKMLNDKIDNILILVRSNVITNENIATFCYMINDIQNNFSKELKHVKPVSFPIRNETSTSNLFKRFAEFSNKVRSNLLSIKLEAIPDYFITLSKLCTKFKEFENILNIANYKNNVTKQFLTNKRIEICSFFYHTIIRWTFFDIKELAVRFLQKKIMYFEQKVEI